MTLNVKTDLKSPLWTNKGEIFVYGYGFANGILLKGNALADYFLKAGNSGSFKTALAGLNGIFAVIARLRDGNWYAASSPCGIPQLFYTNKDGKVVISDDAYSLTDGNFEKDDNAAWLYRCLAYIPGDATLDRRVKKIEPCNMLCIAGDGPSQTPYYSFLCRKDGTQWTEYEAAGKCFLDILDRVFDRMTCIAGGRQIAIPLSSGGDSRLIATMLRKKGYDNVVCYTVGRKSNPEIPIAAAVAGKLGYRHYVIYAEDKEIRLHDKTDLGYLAYCCNLCNMPWTFEYPAVKHLVLKDIIEPDTLFAPGHGGDFLGGNHIRCTFIDESTSVKAIARRIATSRPVKKNDPLARNAIHRLLEHDISFLPSSVLDDYMMKNWLSRNINISCRLYSYFGHGTLLPLWDNELINFFRMLDPEWKTKKILYTDNIVKHVFEPMGTGFPTSTHPTDKNVYMKQMFKDYVKSFIPARLLHELLPRPQDLTGLSYINRQMEKEVLDNNPVLYSNQHNELSLLWYLKNVEAFCK